MTERPFPDRGHIISRSRAITKPGRYAILPRANRVESVLPHFEGVEAQVLATPQLGARFTQHELLVRPGGGTSRFIDDGLEHFLYVLEGEIELEVDGLSHRLRQGGFSWLPPKVTYRLRASSEHLCRTLWLRRRYQTIEGWGVPDPIISHQEDIAALPEDTYVERHLIPYDSELAFDMAINILIFDPGVYFSYVESHIMEHGLYMLEGRGMYWLNGDYHEVQADDFIYMAPYCPQFFYATGQTKSSYILYKDINRDYIQGL